MCLLASCATTPNTVAWSSGGFMRAASAARHRRIVFKLDASPMFRNPQVSAKEVTNANR